MPYANMEKTFRVLDSRRLGKQRVEAFQILNIILNRTKSSGWRNHPAVRMWRRHANALKLYLNLAIREWIARGYRNKMEFERIRGRIILPKWIGRKRFHSAHKGNLLRKDSNYYSKFGWKESPELPYIWPSN